MRKLKLVKVGHFGVQVVNAYMGLLGILISHLYQVGILQVLWTIHHLLHQ